MYRNFEEAIYDEAGRRVHKDVSVAT